MMVLVAVQELDSEPIAKSILAAATRPKSPPTATLTKIRVQVILEGDYLTEGKPVADPWSTSGDNEMNRTIHAALLRSRINVITDLNPQIFHQKFVVRDPGSPTAAVLTGSTNFTRTDTGTNTVTTRPSQAGNNLNHVVVLHGKKVIDEYLTEFDRLRSGTFGDLHERVEPRPKEIRVGTVRPKPLFAPRHGPEMEIMKQMLKAEHRVDFAMFTFAQSSGIDDTMIRLVDPTRRFRGVLDRSPSPNQPDPELAIASSGTDARSGSNRRPTAYKAATPC